MPPPPLPLAAIVTTEGITWFATWVTGHALTVVEEPDVELGVGLDVGELDAQPPTTRTAPAAPHVSHRRELRARFDSITLAPCLIVLS